MPLLAEYEIEFYVRHGLVRNYYSLVDGALVWESKCLCSSTLTLPLLLRQEEDNLLSVHSATPSKVSVN